MINDIYVTRAALPELKEYVEEISSIWDTHWLTNMGPKHKRFEEELKKILNTTSVSLFSNGHMALELLIQALDLSGEVITSPYTFASTTHAIVRNGLKPVFCDITRDEYVIDAGKIESLITENTTAIIPIHTYGNICDVEKIDEIAKKHNLKVIYDAAHAFGVEYKNKSIACYGNASMFSFHATKVFNSIEGGAICSDNIELEKKLYQLKNFGIKDQECVDGVGANAKMNEFQAAMGLCNLRHVFEQIEERKRIYELYVTEMESIHGIKTMKVSKDIKQNYAYFPIYVDEKEYGINRNQLFKILEQNDVHTRKYFYPITSAFDCYSNMFNPELTPVALDASHNILTLPIYSGLSEEDVIRIISIIKTCKR